MFRQIMILKKDKKKQQGMTLVELMFAGGIMAFVLSMIFTSVVTVGMNSEIHTQRLQAESVVNEILDQISRTDVTQILNFTPNLNHLPGNRAVVRIEAITASGSPISLPTTTSVSLPNPLEVRVTLTWQTTRGYTITKRGSTYVSN
ncbi:MAG TPA: type II secretion system protein [Candidatus Hydrogenedens sp.]|nr:type II secretion system protein [Candidatus Hydrogenedens sp.]HOL20637.1 type II secretion system protein [Candidatus Hydrogenedens sp.]